jgi:hypothetical protein
MNNKGKVMLAVLAVLIVGAIVAFSAKNIIAQQSSESVVDANINTASTCNAGGCTAESCNCKGSCGCSANGGTCGCGGNCAAGPSCGCGAK